MKTEIDLLEVFERRSYLEYSEYFGMDKMNKKTKSLKERDLNSWHTQQDVQNKRCCRKPWKGKLKESASKEEKEHPGLRILEIALGYYPINFLGQLSTGSGWARW